MAVPDGWMAVHVPGWNISTAPRLLDGTDASIDLVHFGDLDPEGVKIGNHLREHYPRLRWAVPDFWHECVPDRALRGTWPEDPRPQQCPGAGARAVTSRAMAGAGDNLSRYASAKSSRRSARPTSTRRHSRILNPAIERRSLRGQREARCRPPERLRASPAGARARSALPLARREQTWRERRERHFRGSP